MAARNGILGARAAVYGGAAVLFGAEDGAGRNGILGARAAVYRGAAALFGAEEGRRTEGAEGEERRGEGEERTSQKKSSNPNTRGWGKRPLLLIASENSPETRKSNFL